MKISDLALVNKLFSSTDVKQLSHFVVATIAEMLPVNRVSILLKKPDSLIIEWLEDEQIVDDRAVITILSRHAELFEQQHQSAGKVSKGMSLEGLEDELSILGISSPQCLPVCSDSEFYGVCLVSFAESEDISSDQFCWVEDYLQCFAVALRTVKLREEKKQSDLISLDLLNLIEDSLIVFDDYGTVKFVNASLASMLGKKINSVIGLHYLDLPEKYFATESLKSIQAELRNSLQTRENSRSFTIGLQTVTGIQTFLAQIRVSADHKLLLSFKRDAPQIIQKKTISEDRYERLVEHADAIVLSVDCDQNITFISHRSIDFFGVAAEDFIAREPVNWIDLAHPEDRAKIRKTVEVLSRLPRTFDEEFRIVNHFTGRIRWLLIRFIPVFNDREELTGWEGFGFDITQRRDAQEALEQQNRRIKALFTVSAAISGFIDPANISSRGLSALCEATGADAAVCYLYLNREERKLSLVSHHGFNSGVTERLRNLPSVPNLSKYVAESGHPMVIPDLRNDPRANPIFAEEGLRSAVLVPVQVEDDLLGTIVLFSNSIAKFDGSDVMLVNAAASQIGLAARQAQLFTAYRNQTKSLAALYRMSRELTRNLSLEQIFQNAFSILRDELGLTRLWLGMLNETGSRLIGQAAYGPGWKRRLVEMNVELSGEDNPIAKVVATRTPVVIKNPAEVLGGFGFRKLFSTLEIHSIVFVPIIADLQVIGVLAVQPGHEEELFDSERMSLLTSLADEIANVVLTKRLEERVSEGDKMRAAGLLAAGIAHNFNNLLQAILGQASLIDMQKDDPKAVSKAARIVVEAANKGSSLVKQLLSFAHLEYPAPEVVDINSLIERNISQLSRLLDDEQHIQLKLKHDLPKGHIDPQQLIRILISIVKNSSEAMQGESGTVEIFTDTIAITHSNPHFEVPYGRYVRIGIRDSGVGMDAETRRRCFEPFFTTKDRDPASGLSMTGAGLGLASAYALARRNGGRLVVDSRPGYGSLFTVYIPVEESELAKDLEDKIDDLPGGEKVSTSSVQVEKIKNTRPKEQIAEVATVFDHKSNDSDEVS